MKIPKEISDRIVSGNIKEMYGMFMMLEGEYTGFKSDYQKVRHGINIFFDIYDLWEESGEKRIIVKAKNGIVYILKNPYDIEDYRSEKENRKKVMIKAIMENTDITENISPRGG